MSCCESRLSLLFSELDALRTELRSSRSAATCSPAPGNASSTAGTLSAPLLASLIQTVTTETPAIKPQTLVSMCALLLETHERALRAEAERLELAERLVEVELELAEYRAEREERFVGYTSQAEIDDAARPGNCGTFALAPKAFVGGDPSYRLFAVPA